MAAWLRAKVRGLGLGPRPLGCTPALSVTQKRHCSCDVRLVALYEVSCDFAFAEIVTGCITSAAV